MKRLAVLGFVIILVVSLFLSACSSGTGGSGSSGESGDTSTDKDVVTIRMAVSGSSAEKALRYETADLFMEKNPHIKIEWVDIGNERYQQTLTLISGGNAPDIFYLNDWVLPLAERGVFMPLDDIVDGDPSFNLNEFYPNLVDALRYEGKLYALPQEVSPIVVYYNEELFEAAGLELPTDDWTQQDFFNAAKVLSQPDNQYGYIYSNWIGHYGGWIHRNGGKILVDDYTKSGFDQPGTLEGLRVMRALIDEGISPNPAEIQAMGQGDEAMFRNQQAAMIMAGLWWLPAFLQEPLDFKWNVVKVPKGGDQTTGSGVLNWAISADTKHPEEAWEVLKFFVGHEGMEIVAKYNMALPASTYDVANQMILDSNFPSNVGAFIDAANDVDYTEFRHPRWAELSVIIGEQLDLMLLGEQTPEETQKNIHEELTQLLGK